MQPSPVPRAHKFLITGAAGFIGSHLARHLSLGERNKVVGIDNLRCGDWSRCPASVDRIERDLDEFSESDWKDLLKDVDIIFHLAAEKYNSSRTSPELLLKTNVNATERLIRSAASAGVRRFVFTSSLYAYGSLGPELMSECDLPQPITLYGASKVAGEHFLRCTSHQTGFSWNVARLFFIYGPRQFAQGGYKSVINSNFERILSGHQPQVNGSGNQELDYVYIDDCIDALVKLGTADIDQKTVNVSSSCGLSINTLTEAMREISKTSLPPMAAPADWTEGTRRIGNNSLITELFGWKPTTSIEKGLLATYEALRDGR